MVALARPPGKQSLILPTLGRTEEDVQASGRQFVTVEDSFSMVHASNGQLEPLSNQMRSEPAILAGIAYSTAATGEGRDQLTITLTEIGRAHV